MRQIHLHQSKISKNFRGRTRGPPRYHGRHRRIYLGAGSWPIFVDWGVNGGPFCPSSLAETILLDPKCTRIHLQIKVNFQKISGDDPRTSIPGQGSQGNGGGGRREAWRGKCKGRRNGTRWLEANTGTHLNDVPFLLYLSVGGVRGILSPMSPGKCAKTKL